MAIAGTPVGSGVDVDSITGTSVAVQAVRMIRQTIMNLFIRNNYMLLGACRCERTALAQLVRQVCEAIPA